MNSAGRVQGLMEPGNGILELGVRGSVDIKVSVQEASQKRETAALLW